MAEAVSGASGARASQSMVGEAIQEAVVAACIALLMFIAIIGIKVENAQGGLELAYRIGTAFAFAIGVGLIRLLFDLLVWRNALGKIGFLQDRPKGTFKRLLIPVLGALYVLGGYFFFVPGARQEMAESAASIFFDASWRSHIRILLDLISFVFLSVFAIVTTMAFVYMLRLGWQKFVKGQAIEAEQFNLEEFGKQFAIALLIIAIALPFLVVGPQQRYALDTAIQVLTYIMLGWGLNIVVGLAGLLDLGYVAFYAVGAYSYALIATEFGWSFWVCLPLAGLFAALWGIILGFPVLRLRGDYLAIVTLAFGEIIRIVLLNWYSLTNGPDGISRIPDPTLFGLEFSRYGDNTFHQFMGWEYNGIHKLIFMYYLILILALLVNFVTNRLRRLPVGRAWEALREDEIACRSLGINTVTTKLTAFAIGAMFGGFAGSFFATRQGFISPESFVFHESALILAIVVLGGLGSQIGVVIAAVALIGSSEFFRDLAEYRMLIFGACMVAIMVWRPRGVIASRAPTVALKERRSISASMVQEGHG